MSSEKPRLGTVRIAPSVLAMIVRLTTQETPGVVAMGAGRALQPGGGGLRPRLGRQGASEGVRLVVLDDAVAVEVAVIAQRGTALRQLGQTIQRAVADALQHMVGMPVSVVNVHIENVVD